MANSLPLKSFQQLETFKRMSQASNFLWTNYPLSLRTEITRGETNHLQPSDWQLCDTRQVPSPQKPIVCFMKAKLRNIEANCVVALMPAHSWEIIDRFNQFGSRADGRKGGYQANAQDYQIRMQILDINFHIHISSNMCSGGRCLKLSLFFLKKMICGW